MFLNRLRLQICAMFAFMAYAYVPATAATLTGMGVNTGLTKKAWDKSLLENTTSDDVFETLSSTIDAAKNANEVPNSIFMKVPANSVQGARSMTFTMSNPLYKAPQLGNASAMLGNEEDLSLLYQTIYYNEMKKSVAFRQWGIDFEDIDSTGVYAQITPKLSKFWKEFRGRRIREALLMTYAEELTAAPVSLKQQLNSNIWLPNLADSDNPSWLHADPTTTAGSAGGGGYYSARTFGGTYVQLVANAMIAASGTGATSKALLSVDWLNSLEIYCRTRLQLNPISFGDRNGYVFLVSPKTKGYLFNPSRTGSIGDLFSKGGGLNEKELSIPGILGRYGCLYFVEDERAPTLTVGGTAGSYTLKPGYVQPGNYDDRNLNAWSASTSSPNYVFDVNYILGAGAIWEWMVQDLKYAKEQTEYTQLAGKGSFILGGIGLSRYDVDSPTDGAMGTRSLVNKGSCVVLTSRTPIATVS